MRLEEEAYTTLLLHCAKYPAAAVNGVLIGTYDGVQNTVIAKAIPLQHLWTALSPMVEAGLSLVNASLPSSSKIVGIYYAPSDVKSAHKAELNSTAIKIAQTIASRLSGDAIALQVDNAKLSAQSGHPLNGFTVSSSGQTKQLSAAEVALADDKSIVNAKQAIARGAWKDLVDFDGKLLTVLDVRACSSYLPSTFYRSSRRHKP